jgi:hypothetical protein
MRSRRLLASLPLAALASTLALGSGACLKQTRDKDKPVDDKPKPAAGFPEGYTQWKKVNAETIVREEEKIAREVYAQVVDGLGPGTVLVKEQYAYEGGTKGALQLIAVMRRTADSTRNKGWTFAGYDPTTKASKGEETACTGCHSLQEDNDFLFSDKGAF